MVADIQNVPSIKDEEKSFYVFHEFGEKGHKKFECKKVNSCNAERKAHPTEDKTNTNEFSFVALHEYGLQVNKIDRENISFILDSGATDHLISSDWEEFMVQVNELERPVNILIANGERMTTTKKGKISLVLEGKEITLEGLLVPGLSKNLLSINQLTRKGVQVTFVGTKAVIKTEDSNFSIDKSGKIYEVEFQVKNENRNYGHSTTTSIDEKFLWHRRLGHLNRKSLQKMKLPVSEGICSDCMKGKATRLPFIHCKLPRSTRIGELIHTDLCGPITPSTDTGDKYFQVIVDDYSHFTQVCLLKSKSEACNNLIDYVNRLETQHNTKVYKIRCDNGGEFANNVMRQFAKNRGILLQMNVPYTSQQNGVSERMNRTLFEKARSMMSDSDLPKTLWGEAIKTATYLLNRSPTSALRDGIPAEKWYGSFSLTKIRVFGCKAWYTVLPRKFKLDARGAEARLVGYNENGYRLYDLKSKTIKISRDVVFDETKLPDNSLCVKMRTMKVQEKTDEDCTSIMSSDEKNEDLEVEYNDQQEKQDGQQETQYDQQETQDDQQNKQHGQQEKQDNQQDKQHDQQEKKDDQQELRRVYPQRERNIPKSYADYFLYDAVCMLSQEDPETYEKAIESEVWVKAIEKELEAHKEMNTWDEIELPEGKKAIDTKWVFRTKENGIKKARLVAKGFQEKIEEVVYSPVAKMSTIRMLVSLAVQKNWEITQLDVPTAFLNGILTTDVYIKVPKGVKKEGLSNVLKLNRALYGLKEAPKCWNETFDKFAKNNGFLRSKSNVCLYVKDDVLMLLYVDDILLVGSETSDVVKNLKQEFNVKDMGDISTYLGIEFKRTDEKMEISQCNMINKVLQKFSMENCKGACTPLEPNFQVSAEEELELVDVPFRELIGSLMYISLGSRPDITYAVSFLSRYLDKPNKKVWIGAKRVLRYLQQTKHMSMVYKKDNDQKLIAFSDSDWASDPKDRKSVTGGIIFFCGNPVAWFSKKQNCVTLSSTEAEYVAGALVCAELMSLKALCKDMIKMDIETSLFIDNQGAINISKAYENSRRSKHIDVKYHYLKDCVHQNLLSVFYIETKKNVADILTKSLGRILFQEHQENMCLS